MRSARLTRQQRWHRPVLVRLRKPPPRTWGQRRQSVRTIRSIRKRITRSRDPDPHLDRRA
jgi:hypothetical protein